MTSEFYRNWNGIKMEASEFVAHYLGASMLTKDTTGLGCIQKPLKEKYLAFRKSADNKLGPEIGFRIMPSGIELLFPGSHPGRANDDFYEISSIHFVEAVRFMHIKHKDKKIHFAFIPLDESQAANAGHEKLFTQLDKKFKHLEKISHPPMLACVMRRPTGVKAVDCHVFILQHVEDALQMAAIIRRFQAGPGHYDRRSYGPPASGALRRDYPNPDVVPQNRDPARDIGSPRDLPPARESGENYAIYRGRGVELRNEHFRASEPPGRDPDRREFEPNKSFERKSAGYTGFDRRDSDERYRKNFDEDRIRAPPGDREADYVERRPRELRTNAGFVERDSFGRDFQFDNAISHERQRSGDSGSGRPRYGSDKVSGVSPRNEYGGRFDRHSDVIPQSRYNQPPNRTDFDPYGAQPVSGNLRDEPPPRRSYHEQSYPRPVIAQSPPHSPRGRRSPPGERTPPATRSPRSRSPPPGEDEVCSASNLESRQEFDAHGKPIAKVPPNRHAGVRVLPSLPIPGARSHLKPVSPRPEDTSPNQKENEKAPSYNFDPKRDSDEDNPYDNAPDKRVQDGRRMERAFSDDYDHVERRFDAGRAHDPDRVKSDGFKYGRSVFESDQYARKSTEAQGQSSGPQWSYYEEKEKFMRKDRGDGWNYGSDYSENGQHGSKDAEIADTFSKMRAGHDPRHDVDFERGLGYLP